jgi:GNAT superfamily N-acetyltransferase
MTVDLRPMRLDLADMQILCDLLEFERKPHEPLRPAQERLQDRTADGCVAMGSIAELDGVAVGVSTLMKPKVDLFPDTIGIWVVVHPDHRKQGIGALLAEAQRHACIKAGLTAQISAVPLDDAPAIALAEGVEFREVDRGYSLCFDLDTWDAAAGGRALEDAKEAGVEVLSLAQLVGRHVDWSSRLYPLAFECAQDIPTTMGLSAEYMVGSTPDEFESKLQTMRIDMDASFVALIDGVCAATSWIMRLTAEVAAVAMTGTGRAYRRRGLVKALKQQAFIWCAGAGVRWLNTQQHESNRPMLDLNMNVGFTVQNSHAVLRRDLLERGV